MKKVTGFALIGVLVLSLAGAVAFAAPGNYHGGGCFFGATPGQQVNLTDEQKTQIAAWQQERFEHKKQVLQKQVEWGWLTQEQADERLAFMEQCLKDGNMGKMGMGMGMGMGMMHGQGHQGHGMGPMNGSCPNNAPAQQ